MPKHLIILLFILENALVNYLKALALCLLSHYSAEAEKLLSENITQDSENEESLILLGVVLCRKKNFKESRDIFNQVITKVNIIEFKTYILLIWLLE